MKWLNCARIRLTLIVFVAATVIGSGNVNADFTFGIPTNLGPIVNSSFSEWPPSISADGLSLYFCSNRPGGYGGRDLWVTTRATKDSEWGTPVNLGPTVNSSSKEALPSISSDGLSLFFESTRPGGYGLHDLWVTTRATTDDDWGTPVNLGPTVNTSYQDATPGISADGLSLFFESTRSGGHGNFDLWVTTRPSDSESWGTPVNLGSPVNSSAWDGLPCISSDGLALFFTSERTSVYSVWVTTRKTKGGPWKEPVNLGPTVNSGNDEAPGSISGDGQLFFFDSFRPGGYGGGDMWQAPTIPIVDFNGDGIVDSADMCIMIDHWNEDYSLCDIGPMPWGDGIVDVQDLIVLSEHLFEEPGLVAYWKLDETEGTIAYDSAGSIDASLIGVPAWQPEDGMIEGALQLDGTDDYVTTPFVLNPADGEFSVFAWIKGGAPGQVIISQIGGVNWLCTDPLEGNLMTELKGLGRGAAELLSQTNITDGDWHRIGFIWDGSYRTLYVDDVAVAEDAWNNLAASDNGLYLGTGKAMELGSFWFGLIDDVRIYNRAITP